VNVTHHPSSEVDCTDGVDEDEDYVTDCVDSDCAAAVNCAPVCPDLVAAFPDEIVGSTVGYPDETDGSCGSLDYYGNPTESGPDVSIAFTAPATGRYGFDLEDVTTDFGAVLYALDGCGGAELACAVAFDARSPSFGLDLVAGQTIDLVVDATNYSNFGNYKLVVFTPNEVETCDDALDDDADGFMDCYDDECVGHPSCVEDCTNDADDDGDDLYDCEDPDCFAAPICSEDCTDGLDNDVDGAIDCEDTTCQLDAGCPEACADGSDDDADGLFDCADPACTGDPACPSTCPAQELIGTLPIEVAGTFIGLTNESAGSCGGGADPDTTWSFTAPADGTYTFDTLDAIRESTGKLYVRDGCDGVELACGYEAVLDLVGGQTVVVFVDEETYSSDYNLNVR
jgi:hypothetical protein